MKDSLTKSLSPYELWQENRYGNHIPEGSIEDESIEETFPKEPINETEINGDDDFNFHPDWCYE